MFSHTFAPTLFSQCSDGFPICCWWYCSLFPMTLNENWMIVGYGKLRKERKPICQSTTDSCPIDTKVRKCKWKMITIMNDIKRKEIKMHKNEWKRKFFTDQVHREKKEITDEILTEVHNRIKRHRVERIKNAVLWSGNRPANKGKIET